MLFDREIVYKLIVQTPLSKLAIAMDSAEEHNLVPSGPELFFGLAAPVGTDLELVIRHLSSCLKAVGYRPDPLVHLAFLMGELPEYKNIAKHPYDVYVSEHMKAGDDFRRKTGLNDGPLQYLGMGSIVQERKAAFLKNNPSKHEEGPQSSEMYPPIPGRAYVIRSLKHPDEARTLRAVYGRRFIWWPPTHRTATEPTPWREK